MPEEKTEKRKRGRPRKIKVEPPTPISEDRKTLVMATKPSGTAQQEKVTLAQVQQNLHGLYSKVFRIGNSPMVSNLDVLGGLNRYNPYLQNQRLKQIATTPAAISPEDLAEYLKNPENNELSLRAAGWSLSSTQYLYYKILRLAADVPMFKYYKIPQFLETKAEYLEKDFVDEDEFVDEWLRTFDVVNTLKRVALETKRAGKSTYLLRNGMSRGEDGKRHVDFATWQKLPDNFVKLTAIGEHGYIASFDMLVFMNPAYNVSQYPEFIGKIWHDMITNEVVNLDPFGRYAVNPDKLYHFQYRGSDGALQNGIFEYQNEKYLFWVQLPQEICYTFASDSSHPWALPDTAGLFQNLQELTDYSTLAGLVASTPLTAVLTGEAEFIDDCNAGQDQTKLNPETIAGLQNSFNDLVSDNVSAVFLPFKNLKLQSLPNIPNSMDIQTEAVQNFVSLSGEGGILVATDKPSVAQVKGAQLMEEAQHEFVVKQFESVLNMIINKLIGCRYRWHVVLWGGIFSFDADLKRTKELFTQGATFLLPRIASAFDMTLRDVKATDCYIESLGVYKEFKTPTQESRAQDGASVQKDEPEQIQSVGRPAKDINEVDNDNTAASIDQGTNTADMRDFAAECMAEGRCILCGAETGGEDVLCESCKEQFMQGDE